MKSQRLVCRLVALLGIGAGALATPVAASAQSLSSRVETATLTLPHSLEPASQNWCTWELCYLGPRLYHQPRADGSLLVGWTDSSGTGHVSAVSGGALGATHDFPGTRLKGLVAHSDDGYAVLLWDSSTDVMWLSRRQADGSQVWTTSLNSSVAVFDNDVGDSRLGFDGATYAAYYAVYGVSDPYTGHNGDQLTLVSSNGVVGPGGWDFGCSHSMAELVGYHPGLGQTTVLCSSDCYPQKGLNADYSHLLVASDGGCDGMVSLQLGQMAAAESAWKVAFNALDRPCCEAHGIGLATVDASYQTSVAWLTSTDGSTERDPVLARLQNLGTTERYLVGWRTINDSVFHLGVVDGGGAFLEGPESLAGTGIGWGERDDSFRSNPDGSVSWLHGDPSSTTLKVHRFRDGVLFSDGFESGDTSAWSATVP